ncbi:MAG: glutamate 5-kinase [Muribaculaceae bacterium]|nr:glutamate 5-kinase [Muribaculaceae bacterium]
MNHALKRVAIKIGSNVLTRADGSLDVTRLSALVDQIAILRRSSMEVILISSGAVACGRSSLDPSTLGRLDSVDRRQLFSAVGQAKLINRYYDLFREHGLHVGQVLTMKESFSTRRHYLNQRNCMTVMIDNGVIPIVNENDTVSVTELMFTDNDELSGMIATMMNVDALIILSNVDGIYTAPPGTPGSEVISEVNPGADLSSNISTEKSGFGRGGMITKSKIALRVAEEGIHVYIANGKRDNVLTRLLLDRDRELPSTHFVPGSREVSSVKKWIANSAGFAKGEIHLAPKAVEAITSPMAVSILPIGVTRVEGEFEKDDIVTILAPDGTKLGVGKAAASAASIRSTIGRRGGKPVVHYDYLYIE